MTFQITFIEFLGAFLGGALLGALFFGGLWWTVRSLPSSRYPAGLMLASFVLRMGGALTAFYLLMGGRWERLLVSLVGFLAARLVWLRSVQAARGMPPGHAHANSGHP